MATESKPQSKRSSKNENSGEGAAAIEDLLHKLPGVDIDHVLDHKRLTETFKKEDTTLHRLADLQRLGCEQDQDHMTYKPNPYNKSISFCDIFEITSCQYLAVLVSELSHFDKSPGYISILTLVCQINVGLRSLI